MDGAEEYQRLAEIEVDEVKADRQGFILNGRGHDQADYRLDVHFGMPLDPRTRAVLGELLSQADVRIARRAPGHVMGALRARRQRAGR
jgi:hypothetical protein